MPKHSIRRTMGYSAQQLFDIAADVDNYRKFVPLVKESRTFDRRKGKDGTRSFTGELVIRYSKLGINERFVSHVSVDPEHLTVTSTSSEGPVEHMESIWRFFDRPDGGCEVELSIDYKLKRRAIQFLISGMFDMMVRRIHNAFAERARKLYGPPVAPSTASSSA
jgi:coenzyme Q-binding protein COQ10